MGVALVEVAGLAVAACLGGMQSGTLCAHKYSDCHTQTTDLERWLWCAESMHQLGPHQVGPSNF